MKFYQRAVKPHDPSSWDGIDFIDTSNIKYLYHWAGTEEKCKYILEHGIAPDIQGMIYLSAKPLYFNKGYVFLVRIPDTRLLYDWREFWEEGEGKVYDNNNAYFVYVDNPIPKEYITLIKAEEASDLWS